MRTMFVALSFAAGIGLVCWQGAGAAPANPAAVQQAATAAMTTGQVQNAGYYRHRHGGHVKCYHELIVGPYRCHRFWL
jgi:hypothetical protein